MRTVHSNRTPNEQAALDLIRRRKQAYANLFKQDDRFAQDVLADLARFCRGNKSTFDPNPQIQARLDGRREVYLRIAEHLGLNEGELYDIYVKGIK